MAYPTPPRGWDVKVGNWGATKDITRNETLHETAGYSIEFRNTTPASDPKMESNMRDVREDRTYQAFARMRADSIAAGNTMSLEIYWYDEDRLFISGISAHNAILDVANTWEWHGSLTAPPANARYASLRIGKNNSAFTGYFDEVSLEPLPFHFRVRRLTVAQAVVTGINGDHIVVFNTSETAEGATLNVGTGEVTLQVPGLWHITAAVDFDTLADGASAQIKIFKDGSVVWDGDFNTNGAAADIHVTANCLVRAGTGSVITARVGHSHGADRDIQVSTTRMHGTLIDGR